VRQQIALHLKLSYSVHEALFAAAVGRYAEFDRDCVALTQSVPTAKLKKEADEAERILKRERLWRPLSLLPAMPLVPTLTPMPAPLHIVNYQFALVKFNNIERVAGPLRQVAEWFAMRGLEALERGDTEAAGRHFESALKMAGTVIPFPSRGVVEQYRWWLGRYRERPK
jgi:hypothetical protein